MYLKSPNKHPSERGTEKRAWSLGVLVDVYLEVQTHHNFLFFLERAKMTWKTYRKRKIKNGQIRREREREIPFFQGLNKINLWIAEDFVSKGVDAVECDANGNGRHEVLQFRRLVEIVRRRSTFESAVGGNVEAKDSS